jgi:hypothetical protein
VVFGNNNTFFGMIASTRPVTLVIWQKVTASNTENLDIRDQKYLGSSVDVRHPILIINKATFNDKATYRLEVTNPKGRGTSNELHLTVTVGMFFSFTCM